MSSMTISGTRNAPPSRRMPPSVAVGIEARQVPAGLLQVHVAAADALVRGLRLEQAHEVFEVALDSRAEEPAVVVRKLVLVRRVPHADCVAKSDSTARPSPARRPVSNVGMMNA